MTESQIFTALKPLFPANEYALIPQVRNGTGYSKSVTRTADALALSLWPSRGIALHGFELKDSRADVLKELGDPAKADEIGKHCHFWWIVVSKETIIKKDEVPPAWGLIVIDENGVAKKKKVAPHREAAPMTISSMAAMFKAVSKSDIVDENVIQQRIDAAVKKAEGEWWDREKARRENDNGEAAGKLRAIQNRLAEFRKETGIDLLYADWHWGPLMKSVKFVMDGGLNNIETIVSWCDRISREAKQLLGEQECHS